MPEALARSNNDFVLTAEPRRSSRRKSAPATRQGGRGRAAAIFGAILRLVVRWPGRAFLAVGGTALLSMTFANALFMQDSRHPAPFFSANKETRSGKAAGTAPARLPRQIPVPVARPAQLSAAPLVPAQPLKPRPVNIAPAQRAPDRANPRNRDNIGALLSSGRSGNSGQAEPANKPAVSAAEKQKISAVQRALEKLGFYTLKVDGIAGAGTRTAIENFERTSKLPVTGQMNPRTLRRLSRQSGVRIP